MGLLLQADQTIQQIIEDNEYQQGASRGTVNAMAADTTQNWTLTFLNGDVSYARSVLLHLHHSDTTSVRLCLTYLCQHNVL